MQREEFNSLYYSIQSSASAVVVVAAVCGLSRASVSLQLHLVNAIMFYS